MTLSIGATPKLGAEDPSRSFYRYYAGFSEAFVRDTLNYLEIKADGLVLDPWNGAGTTTTVAARFDYRALGIDRNPVLVAIATARGLRSEEALSILKALKSGLEYLPMAVPASPADPLLKWFSPLSVATFRALQNSALTLAGADSRVKSAARRFVAPEALVHVLFFRVARRLAVKIFGSNPTWIKQHQLLRRISVSPGRLRTLVSEELEALEEHFARYPSRARFVPKLILGDTTNIGEAARSAKIAAIISSPPYGTRIDYAIAMAIELACLSPHRSFDVAELRQALIGTTITSHMFAQPDSSWGLSCDQFLRRVRDHPSKASASYYSSYYKNYFSGLIRSFQSIDQLAPVGLPTVLVVQGSYYKEVYLDLASVVSEMLENLGWQRVERVNRDVRVSFTLLNPDAKLYPKPHPPVESVLLLRKVARASWGSTRSRSYGRQ